jgi:ketosteroid isomerase-like protein
MRRLRTAVLAAAAVAAASCSQPTGAQFGQAEASRIRERTQEYARAFNAKDLDKLMAFYPGETVFMPPNSPTVRGKDATRDFYKGMFAEGAGDLQLESRDVGGYGALAYQTGSYSLNRRPPAGEATRDRGKYIFIWREYKAQNAWLIDYTMWSSDLPHRVAAPTPQ